MKLQPTETVEYDDAISDFSHCSLELKYSQCPEITANASRSEAFDEQENV